MNEGNARKCSHCSGTIAPRETQLIDYVAAWLGGFCSPICQLADARERLKTGALWWSKCTCGFSAKPTYSAHEHHASCPAKRASAE